MDTDADLIPGKSRNALLGAALVASLACSAALGQVEIELRPTARLDAHEAITLGRIAELTGPEAEAWRELVIEASPGDSGVAAVQTVSIEQLRGAMEQRPGVNWGQVVLRGMACTILRPVPHPTVRAQPHADSPEARPAADGPTVRVLAIERVAQAVNAAVADVRVEFSDQDRELLDTPIQGRVAEIQPIGKSDRMGLSVRVFEGDRVVADGTVRAKVEVRREVVVALGAIARGMELGEENTAVETRWVGAADNPAVADAVIGMVARGRIKAGQVITSYDVEPAVVVEKGDLVNVDCVSGGVVLRRMMRATEQGRDGEVVEMETLQGRKLVRARMSGRGRAVMVIDPAVRTAVNGHAAGAGPGSEPRRTGESAMASVGGVRISRGASQPEGKRVARYNRLANGKIQTRSDSNTGNGVVR